MSRTRTEALIGELKGERPPVRRTPDELRAAFGQILDWLDEKLRETDATKLLAAPADFDRIALRAGRPDGEAERAALCEAIVSRLERRHPKPLRVLLVKTLRFIGRGESADALARLLDDPDAEISEAARQALANNPSPEAAATLRAALDAAIDPARRVSLIDAIGYRRDRKAVAALGRLLEGKSLAVATAAASALGAIGGPEAARALETIRPKAPLAIRPAVSDALLACAEQLPAEKAARAAAAIYERLSNDINEPARIREAASRNRKAAAE